MSLDVYLEPPKCSHCGLGKEEIGFNITHNLGPMAKEAGIYQEVWRPGEVCIAKAEQMIEPLRKGIAEMKADPERFKALDSSNGWGTYADFLPWLEEYLAACEANPDADLSVSR